MNYSLARVPEAPAFWRPFFLIMKLEPIKALDATANPKPVQLALYMIPILYLNYCATILEFNSHLNLPRTKLSTPKRFPWIYSTRQHWSKTKIARKTKWEVWKTWNHCSFTQSPQNCRAGNGKTARKTKWVCEKIGENRFEMVS